MMQMASMYQQQPPHPQQVVGLPGVSSGTNPCFPNQMYGSQQQIGGSGAGGGGYTLPPTAAYFPMASYSAAIQNPNLTDQSIASSTGQIPKAVQMTSNGTSTENQPTSTATATTQPNTPDLLIHRRQVQVSTSNTRWRLRTFLT